jgi:hypothetical protein
MPYKPNPPYPENAPGDFYVEDQCCISCEAPCSEAPDLMAFSDEHHCYFKKQPSTPEETERAIMACVVSCVRAVRYAGDDPTIIERFRQLDSRDSCDYFFAGPDAQPLRSPDAVQPTTTDRTHPMWDRELDG